MSTSDRASAVEAFVFRADAIIRRCKVRNWVLYEKSWACLREKAISWSVGEAGAAPS